jgi:hypothetical protein
MNDDCDHMVSLRLGMVLVAYWSGWDLVNEETGICQKNFKNQKESSSSASSSSQQSYLFRTCVWQERINWSHFMTLSAYGQLDSIPEDIQVLLYQWTIEHFRDNLLSLPS